MKKWTMLLLTAIIIVAFAKFFVKPKNTDLEEEANAATYVEPQITESTIDIEQIAGGNCGDTITWTLNSNGTLIISGTGAMIDYEKDIGNQPWMGYRKSITALVIEDGIYRVGDRAFQGCSCLKSVVFGKDVSSIGEWAFQNCNELTSVEFPSEISFETGAFRSTPVEWDISAIGSSIYTNSSYYSALSQVVLTGDYREDIINIALSQVGYHEGDSETDYAGGNTNGSGDYTEYGRRLESTGTAWCSEFAS
ncbi:MAG: leucine-rich repeat domain-containing protein, partial [Oscillospiraceae bacterium]|nr:leucine-rich repeat domain-containing protein [Oscillospiraceae bacterium]